MKKTILFLISCCISFASFAQIAPITGPTSLCVGSTITLSDATPGGAWSSSTTSVAIVGSGTGIVTGVSAGTATITYGVAGAVPAVYSITVNPIPAPISAGSVFFLCLGSSVTISDATPGGTWSSSNTSVATIGSSSGIVTGVGVGVSNITYMLPTGCYVTTPVFVSSTPAAPITGVTSICVGSTTTLSDATPGGTWSSAATSIADVGSSSGIVTGISPGTTTITYTIPTGCFATITVTVNPVPAIISVGTVFQVCLGSSITISDATPGGTWSSSTTTVATVGSGTGVVTGVGVGVSNITYMLPTGCYATTPVFVTPVPAPIGGITSVCVGSTTTLSDATTGGTWTSAVTSIADVGSSSGVVTGISPGTTTITYTLSTGCFATITVTVNPVPAPIATGTIFNVCVGSTITISDATPGGTWSSGTTTVATVGSGTGVVTGISPGISIITYMLPGGCFVTVPVAVHPAPAPISGITTVCVGNTTLLSDPTPGGAWTSANTGIATVSGFGLVTGVSPGTTTITFSIPGCYVTTTVTVIPSPAPITGPVIVCVGSTIVLSDATPGGTWSSSNTTMATIGSTSGVVTGISIGGATITYTMPSGCFVVYHVKVVPPPSSILGPSSVCIGSTITLSDATPGGTWASGNTSVATVGSSTGVVTGVSPGTATITYTSPFGCVVAATINVLPLPGAITGVLSMCVGSSTILSNATTGGTWSSGNTTIATVGTTSGIVTGVNPGTATITYTAPSGCFVLATVTVNPLPAPLAIGLLYTVCVGNTITIIDPTLGGTWNSSNTSVATIGSGTGVVTGISPGSSTITYMLSTGCYVTAPVFVTPALSPISGITSICVGNTTALTDAATGGTWSSGNTTVATVVTTSGVVTGISPGTVTITYALPSGCFATITVTVNPNPLPILGPSAVCAGSAITLSDATPGGTWSSSSTANATVGSSSGIVTGVSPVSAIITYTLPGGCFVTRAIKINPAPLPITGITAICVGNTTALTDAVTGGTWSSGNTTVATVVATSGVVTGITPGTSTITYTLPGGCFATITVTVNPNPLPITGPSNVCVGGTITLNDATLGGTWSSSNTAMATVGSSSGVVTGVAVGFAIITYMMPGGCYVTKAVKVVPGPGPINGITTVCVGSTTGLSDATAGGTWSSSNTAVATVVATSGVVTGIGPGTSTITYTLPSGCFAITTVTVHPKPAPISGPSSVCVGLTIVLSDAVPGGVWSSGSPSVASVGSGTGVVTGITVGTAIITYMLPGGCFVTIIIKVTPHPCNAGVDEVTANGNGDEVYPNPAYDELTIKTTEGAYSSFMIANELGQVVIHDVVNAALTKVGIKALPPGLYYIMLKGSSSNNTLKFLKQ